MTITDHIDHILNRLAGANLTGAERAALLTELAELEAELDAEAAQWEATNAHW